MRSLAIAQIAAGGALLVADRRPQDRAVRDLRTADAVLLGGAQAAALVPGVSRSGAIATAARLLRLDRPSAAAVSRQAARPVLVGAAALKAARLARKPPPPAVTASLIAGAASAFVSSLAARPLAQARPAYAAFAVYRIALGVLALRRR